MGECKHEWTPHKNAVIKCRLCGANVLDLIIEQGKQLQQAQATIAAMRLAIETALINLGEANRYQRISEGEHPFWHVVRDLHQALSDTAGSELLEAHQSELKEAYKISEGLSHQVDELNAEIEQLQRENKALRCCGNCINEFKRCDAGDCFKNGYSHWVINGKLVNKGE